MIKENLEKDNRRGNNRDERTWSEVKALANQRKRWRSFTGVLCSIRN
jgi:uncharacterized protein YifE (UPF0438 family)